MFSPCFEAFTGFLPGFFFSSFAALGVSSWHLKLFLLSSKWGDWAQQEVCCKGKDVLMLLRDVKSPGMPVWGLVVLRLELSDPECGYAGRKPVQ